MKATAELMNWSLVSNVYGAYAWGEIVGDTKRRWRDGTRIHTSQIVSHEDNGDDVVIVTLNSSYILRKDRAADVFRTGFDIREALKPLCPPASTVLRRRMG